MQTVSLWWRATLISFAALLALVIIDHLAIRATLMWPIALMQLLPLLVLIPGLYARRYRGAIWLCFVTLFYFLLGVDNTVVQTNTVFYGVLTAVSIITFICALFAARWSQRQ